MADNVTAPDSWISELIPGPQRRFGEFADEVYSDGALDTITRELIAAATASVGRCPHCTNGHIVKALEAGATEEQVAEALAVPWVIGGGTQVMWNKEDLAELLGSDWRKEYIPEADAAFWRFEGEVFQDGELDLRTKELIAIAVASQLRCGHCTRSHISAALEMGIGKREIAEALAVLWVIGGGVNVAWNQEGFTEHLHAPAHT